jgi:hypothetical protein
MDQLRNVLQILKKHHFWLLCLGCIIVGLVAWSMASGKLSKEYASRKGEITNKFSALDRHRQIQNFPNSDWKEAADKLTEEQKKRVRDAWKLVYDEQAQFLKWPEQFDQDFQNRIRSLKQGDDIPQLEREIYMTKVREEFPKLLAIVDAEKHDQASRVGPPQEGEAAPVIVQEKVVWEAASQQAIEKSLQFDRTPTPLQVWLTQEDLWVYQVLLTIIKKVNGEKFVPPVKEIIDLKIAQQAAEKFEDGLAAGLIAKPKNAAASAEPAAPPEYAQPAMPGEGGGPPPDEGRYLDKDGKPMPSGGAAADPFKRMPVFMKLKIDQREIPRLQVECANSPLPVEIRQMRINPEKGGKNATQGESQATRGSGPATVTSDRNIFDVNLEICGIIYIYNPPDAAKVGEDAPAAPAADAAGAQPAVAPGG